MLNRFKNALYGASGSSDDSAVMNDDFREFMLGSQVRAALTRSSSFREDLLNGGLRNRNVASDITLRPRISEKDSEYDTYQYSQHSTSRGNRLKYPYQRPEFLQLKTEDEILVSADHQIRPIILPRDVSRLPWRAGYAECINAGKSLRNEDQATCYQGVAVPLIDADDDSSNNQAPVPIFKSIPWTYFALFDGHAGSAVAVAASNQLHHILAEKLNMVASKLISKELIKICHIAANERESKVIALQESKAKDEDDLNGNEKSNHSAELSQDKEQSDSVHIKNEINGTVGSYKTTNVEEGQQRITSDAQDDLGVSVDDLIKGALESAFWDMDAQIGADKRQHKMPGGCTAIVALFILGKLYVCNAGDSRAIILHKDESKPMSYDFTPVSEQKRLARLGQQCPRLLCDTFTQVEYYPKHPNKSQLGTMMLYRDANMTGFAMKTITSDDLKYPLVCGEGKRSRLLATIGVTRGFGDHEMRSLHGSVPIKPFLTPEPAIMCLNIEKEDSTTNDVLIIGTDGLWDVTSLEKARETVKISFEMFPDSEESRSKYRYMTAAQDLIIQARGQSKNNSVWTKPNTPTRTYASHDDIAVFVVPIRPYKQEYDEWKKACYEALMKSIISPTESEHNAF